MSSFVLPDLGEGLREAEIVSWHVAEGEHVVVDQPLLSVETEKAVVEIPSPQSGHVAKLLARPGDRVAVGTAVLEFEEGAHADAGAVVGRLDGRPAAATERPSIQPAQPVASAIAASPAARARARDLGVDLARVTGTGPRGTITMSDIETAARSGLETAAPLRGARRTMAVNMARAWDEVVHATVHDIADIEAWPDMNDVTRRTIRAIVAGCMAEPTLNASFDGTSFTLRQNPRIDLGIAMDGPDGLFVPVLRDVGGTTPDVWRDRIETFKRGIRDRSIATTDLRGATITLSNFGTIAGRHASLIVVPPQVAILGVGRAVATPVASGNGFALHRGLPLSLSFDHRVITGGMAARFMAAVLADLETAS